MVKLDTPIRSALACAALVVAAAPDAAAQRPSRDEDLAAIAAFNERYLAAINNEDIDALMSLTTEGHIMLPPNRPPVVGKAANEESNRRAFEQFDFDESWNPVETEIFGDWAFQRGTYVVRARPKAGGDERVLTGNFLRIYQRQPNGEWRMIRDMFNSDGGGAQRD